MGTPCFNNPATIGLIKYCVSTEVPLYGNTSRQICLFYNEGIQVTNTSARTGYDRFQQFDMQAMAQVS